MSDFVGKIENLAKRNEELAEKLRKKGIVKQGKHIFRLVVKTGNVYRTEVLLNAV